MLVMAKALSIALNFDTNKGRHYTFGGKKGKVNHLSRLGTGDWIEAEGRDKIHGCGGVVNNMDIYFKT